MNEQTTVFGIDLGTTYSCISYLDETGRAEVCHSMEGDNTTPSVVIMPLEEGEESIVGVTAKQQAGYYPDRIIAFVKQKIGRVDTMEYGPEDDRKTTTPIDVSAEVLKKVARDAEAYCNKLVKDVVITVPAYFGENEKAATKEAGLRAGLNVINIVEEPTAAAFYYGCQHDEDETILIFDLGGGTFDVTAMRLENGNLRVITTDGNHELGGFKWDKALMDYVEEKFRDETGYDGEIPPEDAADLPFLCEAAKKTLSSAPKAMVKIDLGRAYNKMIEVTREEFDEITEGLLAQAIELTRDVVDRVEQDGIKIDKILLVGGSTKMPQVKRALVEEFGLEPVSNEPDEAVSKGAAIYAGWSLMNIITSDGAPDGFDPANGESEHEHEYSLPDGSKVKDVQTDESGSTTVTLEDENGEMRVVSYSLPSAARTKIVTSVSSKSFGIKVVNNATNKLVIWNLILKDTVMPIHRTVSIPLSEDNMNSVSIELFQCEARKDDNTGWLEAYDPDSGIGVKIGEGILSGLPSGLRAGTMVDINISYELQTGLLEITGAYEGQPLEGSVAREYSEGIGKQEI